MKKKSGFTLAEVLITLSIIGVIAAIVMPSVIASYQYKTIGVKLSKFLASTEEAARAFVVTNGSFRTDSDQDRARILDFINDSFLITGVTDTSHQANYLSFSDTGKVDERYQVQPEELASTFAISFINDTVSNSVNDDLTDLTKKIIMTKNDGGNSSNEAPYRSSDDGNWAVLKDGTYVTFEYLTPTKYTVHPAAVDTKKVGLPMINVTFVPNVTGLSSTSQQQYHFVITEFGYVVPHDRDNCLWTIYRADWKTTSKMYSEGQSCNQGLSS